MKKVLLLLLAAILATGCASTRLTYEKAKNYDTPIERLFVIEIFPEDEDSFTKTFENKFSGYLDKAGITYKLYTYNAQEDNLSLDDYDSQEEDLMKSIDEFAPFHLMSIAVTSIEVNATGTTMKAEIVIRDMVTEKKIWVANVKNTGGLNPKKMAGKLTNALMECGLIKEETTLNN